MNWMNQLAHTQEAMRGFIAFEEIQLVLNLIFGAGFVWIAIQQRRLYKSFMQIVEQLKTVQTISEMRNHNDEQ